MIAPAHDAPPETWAPARKLATTVLRPIERFLHIQAASGIVLLATTAIALVWANLSPASYERLWHTPITLGIGGLVFAKSIHFWINDGLMAVFFLLVGLEIRREIHEGELSDLRRAALPIASAIGGMLAPAAIYVALCRAEAIRGGWGIPTATDIAFAVGVLALLGKRVPPALRVLLLALAVIDDIGAILVIAFAYSEGVSGRALAVAAAGIAVVVVMQRVGVRRASAYIAPGAVIWVGMLAAGVHPTIAGVILGLLTPVRVWFEKETFLEVARSAIDEFVGRQHDDHGHDTSEMVRPLRALEQARREAVSPVVRLQTALHPWVAYGIMPLFALANAGVNVRGVSLDDPLRSAVALGVLVGLVAGKPLGILLVTFVTVKARLCSLPRGVDWRGMAVIGAVAGIGFTMAIFIAGLALPDAALIGAAKLGVLAASGLAAVIGLLVGRFALGSGPAPGAARTESEAEASTHT
jgi:NhaA family Na+:H+ antiporter